VTPPGVAFDSLPRIDVVLISHDHFDLADRFVAPRAGESLRVSPTPRLREAVQ
jgi:L-ascorbate metabolism protein UlaG (beta-lactamase superfamily)